jgi:thymidylate synthase ThyX
MADSMSPAGQRITTVLCRYPRIIHAELLTHRVFSRNSSSTRAIPLAKQIQAVKDQPFVPRVWRKNAKGMQPFGELSPADQWVAEEIWMQARDAAVRAAEEMDSLGTAKELAGRVLEPFSWIRVLITATEWENFFTLRCHPDAQYEIRELAEMIRDKLQESRPVLKNVGEWHIPFDGEWGCQEQYSVEARCEAAIGRCARLSYQTHDGDFSIEKDRTLFQKLVTAGHLSPLEHVARCDDEPLMFANFRGWCSYRYLWERNQIGSKTW